jgi:hypothetical protein
MPPGLILGESDETVAQKMRQLDESAPAKKYSECKADEGEGEVEAAKKGGAQANANAVWWVFSDLFRKGRRRLTCAKLHLP